MTTTSLLLLGLRRWELGSCFLYDQRSFDPYKHRCYFATKLINTTQSWGTLDVCISQIPTQALVLIPVAFPFSFAKLPWQKAFSLPMHRPAFLPPRQNSLLKNIQTLISAHFPTNGALVVCAALRTCLRAICRCSRVWHPSSLSPLLAKLLAL